MLESESTTGRRVLVLMPTRRDAERAIGIFREAGLEVTICSGLAELCQELRVGAGAVLITDDLLLEDINGQVAEALRAQPAWSNVPFVVLAHEGANAHLQRSVSDALTNLTVVERPVRTHTLVSLMRSALRGRQHQYQVRDALRSREQEAAALLVQKERARFAMAAGGLGSWDLDLHSMEMDTSELCRAIFGRPTDQPFTYKQLQESIHPDDRTRVARAVQNSLDTGVDYDVEYRCCWPNGETHWVMVRGRVAYDEAGNASRLAGVSLDITERKRMYDALQESRAELEAKAQQLLSADRLKDEFLATLAHELRNPLAPIRTGVELLASDDPVSGQIIEVIRRQLAHMVRLIDDLLDVSRITRGKLELKRERVSLAQIIEAAVEASQPLIRRGGQTLRIALPERPIHLDADLTRLAQVIGNLLNNASKYTPSAGTIELSTELQDDQVVIRVRDDGIGIAPDQLDHVFQMFSQVNRTLDRSQGGLGIGLALVRQLVSMHGGSVRALSDGAGAGSVFELRLPVSPAPSDDERAHAVSTELPVKRRILVVDDNDDAAEMVSRALRRAGHETLTAFDGPSAIEEVERWQPNVVLLDIGLPGMSGYDVARALRNNPRHHGLALIALTGWGSQDDRRKANEAGFDLHLTKPVDAAQLRQALDQVVRRAS
jgi:PAS domain S-box-containing protein